jgi:CRISPR-associated endoribonuclease Cas6
MAPGVASLRVAPLRVELIPVNPLRLSQYGGAVFRGGFGQFLRKLFCTTGASGCGSCARVNECIYSTLFETPVERDSPVLRKYPYAPHPFVLVPPLEAHAPAAELTLIGRAIDWLPYTIQALEMVGASGRGGCAFRVACVRSSLDRRTVYDGALRKMVGAAPEWRAPNSESSYRCVRIEFLTPVRLRIEGRYGSTPDFGDVMRALVRRLHLLAAVHGDGAAADGAWRHEVMRNADVVRTCRTSLRSLHWERTSARQRCRINMDGLLGTIEAEGPLAPLAPYLQLGEWINVGSGTSLGMGRYRLAFGT